jgi:hypothetical protein
MLYPYTRNNNTLHNRVEAAQKPLEQLWSLKISTHGDLYLDVAEAYRQGTHSQKKKVSIFTSKSQGNKFFGNVLFLFVVVVVI